MELKNNSQAPHRGTVEFVNGPVIRASGMREFAMREVVKVGPKRLMGEIIKMDGDEATIQVYEDTDGLRVYEEVVGTGEPLSVELGPGLIGSVFDGIGRPLDSLLEREGMYISPGAGRGAGDSAARSQDHDASGLRGRDHMDNTGRQASRRRRRR